MVRLLECEHPSDWLLRLKYEGRGYSYCLGCLIENAGLSNLETYDNPFIKGVAKKVVKPKKEEVKEEKLEEKPIAEEKEKVKEIKAQIKEV